MPARQRYSGKYTVKKPEKYIGDPSKVEYRSGWERTVFRWCENNDRVHKWGSEVVVVDYICGTDKRKHRYLVDLFIQWNDGTRSLIEIKPDKETRPPKKTTNHKRRKFMQEAITYVKNTSKWHAAKQLAEKHGWKWEIWTEKTMRAMGIRIV